MHEYELAPGFSGGIYKLNIDSAIFHDLDSASVEMCSDDSNIVIDSRFASNIEMKLQYLPSKTIFHQTILRTRFLAPYDTKCRNPPSELASNNNHRFELIDQKSTKLLNISVSFYPTFDSRLNICKIISYRIFSNETLRKELLNIINSTPTHLNTCKLTTFL